MLETLKTLPDQPISLALDPKTFAVELHTDKGKFKLSGENGEEFPTLPEMTGNQQFELPSDALLTGISNTLFAVGTDELRLAMTGVKMECAGDTLSFVATDAHKLVLHKQGGIEVPASAGFIVPRKALNLLKSTLPGDTSPVKVSYNNTHVVFAFGDLELTCRLIDQKYPDYQAVIPKDGGSRLLLRRTEFLSSLRRISIYSSKSTYQVRLSIKGNAYGDTRGLKVDSVMTVISRSSADLQVNAGGTKRFKCEIWGSGNVYYAGIPDLIEWNDYGTGKLLPRN